MRKFVIFFAVALAMLSSAKAADAPKVKVTPLATLDKTVTGQPVVLPKDAHALVVLAEFPPGARLPEHKHPYPHYVYVLEGTLTVVNTETGKTFTLKQGDALAEMMNTWHYGINKTAAPVKLLVIDEVPPGVKSNTVPRP
ncbi:MAG: cupin domain-containing protein [Proteobacteria bacterium]|nr:cupin domain-containing protein [Pseudomonadota bacterium]